MENIKIWINNSYLNNKKLSFNSCLFISGYSGIGKTYIINKIANELELFIINIDSSNCSSSAQLLDILLKSFVSSLIQILTNDNKKKIIIIDDFDILMAIDNTININLYNFILNNTNKLKHIPIICIINIDLIKKLGEIKKKCEIIKMPNMDEYDIYNILKIYKNDITFDETLKIITDTNYNLSLAIKTITNTNYNEKDDIININYLYGNEYNKNKIRNIILKEEWIIPLNFHENLINEIINNRNGNKKNKEFFYKDFIKNFLYYDILIFKNNDIAIEIFINSIYKLYDYKIKNKKNENNLNNFTKMLSYLSLQKKNNKNLYNKLLFPLNQIGNYHLNIINKKNIY
jgi:hypothetical protein